jgi:hypothetical protein
MPDSPFPHTPFPRTPFPPPGERFPWPDTSGPRRRPPTPDDEHEAPDDRRKDRRRDQRKRPDQGPDVDIDPRTGERRRPKDPCDLSPFHRCAGGMTFDEALDVVTRMPDYPTAHSSGREAVRDGACWVDGRPRTREEALAVGATHQTWNLPDGRKLATIKCCPCCIPETGAIGMHCTIN